MRLILMGPPGSGKGTQAKLLSERHRLVHISTGDILREAVRGGTPAGKKAQPYMSSGKLAPDDVVNDVVAERFQADNRPDRFVLDGYPRTLPQAAALDSVLRQQFLDLTGVISLLVDDDMIVQRAKGRWICPKDQTPYHEKSKPPRRPGICDLCDTPLIQREDDKESTVRQRLKVYHEQTADLIPHYRRQGLLHEVPGVGDIEEIHQRIVQASRGEPAS
jgi:adenylate kinase